jgi:phosphoglycolate phosphatase
MSLQYKAVLFDLDGTLLDTIEDLADSMNTALAERGFPPRGVAECKLFVGDGVEMFATRALPEGHRDEATVAAVVARHRREYSQRWANKTCAYDGVPGLLDELSSRGVAMAVLSNKPDDFTDLMVARLLPKWKFAAVRGARKGEALKPSPDAALWIASKLGLAPAEFLYVGDTNTDMQTANGAGMCAVGALWGFRSAGELLANGAKVLIERPLDLVGLL